ncbi:MAG: SurA N-terminal domain-containing protein [Gemmatimonadales bacterium]|nr:SurA N-terminal domain-containing protein [Gemmatimonadales bacterium]
MLRTMRSNAKWVFYILAFSFIGWLAVGQVMDIMGPSGNVVLRVNGREVQITEYQQRLQAAYDQYRQQYGTAPLSREDDQQVQDQVVNQLVQDILLQQEYRRLGIRVTDAEVIEAARTSPPPEIMRDPQFHTDGQFDVTKWQRFLQTGATGDVLAQIEGIYRDRLPQIKLAQYLTADVYISDSKLWRMYKDQHDSVRVAVLPVWPYQMADSSPISDAELQRYIGEHEDELQRPAVAYVRFVAQPRLPNAEDSAATRATVARVRAEITRGAPFAEVAQRESADTVSGQRGGEIGWLRRDEQGFDQEFLQGLRGLRPGQTSAPILTQFGYHLIRVDSARGDSMKVRHILIPVSLQSARLDYVEARADTLERLAAEQTDPRVLEAAAERLGLPVSPRHRVVDGERLNIGRYVIPDVSVWAFEAQVGETSPVIEAQPAFYVFRLDSLVPAGVPPLADIRDQIAARVRGEKQKVIAKRRADSLAAALRGTPDLVAAATARGLAVQPFGPFPRLEPPSYLAREPLVIGTAFGLGVGERSGVLEGEGGYFVVQSLGRRLADSSAWVAQRDAQRAQLLSAARQARIDQYMRGLRERASIVDRRKEIFRTQVSDEPLDLGF